MVEYQVDTTKNLQDLLKRLNLGSTVKGRILGRINNEKYILRIYGYNIITESKKILKIGDELNFEIKGNNNHLTIKLINKKHTVKTKGLNITI